MIRGVTASLIALMVFWHTIAGCCMHHVHASPTHASHAAAAICCDTDTARCTSSPCSDDCNDPNCEDGSCEHGCDTDSGDNCHHGIGTESAGCGCPHDSPGDCPHDSCNLGVLQASAQLQIKLQIDLCAFDAAGHTELLATSQECRGNQAQGHGVMHAALRPHLALNVMRL